MSRIYVACPMSTYETILYTENVARVRELYPGSEITEVRGLYHGGQHFMATYRGHIGKCTALVFFTAKDGTIGKGVFQEITFAQQLGIPVRWLDWMDAPYHIQVLDYGRDWRKYARIWPVQVDESASIGWDGAVHDVP